MRVGQITSVIGSKTEALQAYQQARTLQEALVREHPTVVAYRQALWKSYFGFGFIQVRLDDLKGARDAYKKVIFILSNFVDGKDNQDIQKGLAVTYGNLAWVELLNRQPQKSIDLSTKGLEIDPTQMWIKTNLAHGYLFDHQYEHARVIYLENKDIQMYDKQTFADAVLDDFLKFRQKGLTHPDMEQIGQLFGPSAPSTQR